VSCGNCMPTFRDNVSVPSSRVKRPIPLKMGPIRCSETSVNNYYTTPLNMPEEFRSHFDIDSSILKETSLKYKIPSHFLCSNKRERRNKLFSLSFKTSVIVVAVL
jgi:hypothetical protein